MNSAVEGVNSLFSEQTSHTIKISALCMESMQQYLFALDLDLINKSLH